MKKIIFCFIAFVLILPSLPVFAAQKVSVEILYLNHGPLQPALQEIDNICAQYKDKISVSRYDFDSPEGEQFKNKKGINQHVPLMIWIAGKNSVVISGKEIKFAGFPTGSGPAFFQGKWIMKDFHQALDQATRKR
jgi:hypothetical protein